MARNFIDDRCEDVVASEGDWIGAADRANDDRVTIDRDSNEDLTDEVENVPG